MRRYPRLAQPGEFLPGDFDDVRQMFSRRGAYRNFRALVTRRQVLDRWYDFQSQATRRAVRTWGLETQCAEPRDHSSVLTAVRTPEGHSADRLRAIILEKFNMSLGTGLGLVQDRVFRIGHLGDFGDLQLIGTLGGVEMGLRVAGIPHNSDYSGETQEGVAMAQLTAWRGERQSTATSCPSDSASD